MPDEASNEVETAQLFTFYREIHMKPFHSALCLASVLVGCESAPAGLAGPSRPSSEQNTPARYGETRTFARIPPGSTGYPEGIEVIGQRVFVTAPATLPTSGTGSSRIYVFSLSDGKLEHIIRVQGQDTTQEHAVVGTAADADGRLYVVETQQGVLRFDPRTNFGQETYGGSLPDLPPCGVGPPQPCSPTLDNRPPLPNDLAFDGKGNLYLTDSFQNTIWYYPPRVLQSDTGAVEAQIWYQTPQDPAHHAAWGPNGIELSPDGSSLYFVTTVPSALYRVQPGPPSGTHAVKVTELEPRGSGVADGIVFGRSGRLYISLAGLNQILVLDPGNGFREFARFPDPVDNQLQDTPYDNPASLAWNRHTRSLLIVNHGIFSNNPLHFGVLEAWVDDRPAPVPTPRVR